MRSVFKHSFIIELPEALDDYKLSKNIPHGLIKNCSLNLLSLTAYFDRNFCMRHGAPIRYPCLFRQV